VNKIRKYIENDKKFDPNWVELWMKHHETCMRVYEKSKEKEDLDRALNCMRKSILCREIRMWKKYCK
jgi:hypothetical protein